MPQMRSEAEVRAILGELITDKEGFEDWPVERIAISDFKPAAYNPRTISDSGLKRLARSLKANGRLDTLVVNRRTGNLVSGHQRFSVLLAAGLTETWATVVDVPEYREKAMNLAANNREAQGEFEMEGLADLLKELQEIDAPDFSIEDTAFELGEVMDILAEHGDEPEGNTDPDEVPEVPVKPVSRTGDLWLLGEHRVCCGDSTKAADVERVMGGEKADLVFTSPPYAQQRDYTDASDCSDWDGLMQGVFGSMIVSDKAQILVNLGLVHKDGEWIPYWEKWIERMRGEGWKRFGWYVWDKMQPPPGNFGGRLCPTHEWVFHFNKNACEVIKTRHNKTAGKVNKPFTMDKSGSTVEPGYVAAETGIQESVARIGKSVEGSHPAAFPVGLPQYFVECWPGLVYDPFLGSGTTLIACEKLGRRCYGIEIDCGYTDVIVRRYEEYTGSEATLDGDGRTFTEIAEERSGE